jgi:dihydroorotate dehydrogenase (fumarate)
LRSPLVASASPLTGTLDNLRSLDDAGVGAIVLPSLFEEQLQHDAWAVERLLLTGSESFSEATSLFPDLCEYNTGPDHYLSLIGEAKAAIGVPVIASLNGITPGGWIRFARLMQSAGADALELNVYQVAADPGRSSATVEADTVELVANICDSVTIPVAVKLSPFWSSLAHLAAQLEQAGASGLVLFNRFYQPDLDLESLRAVPKLHLSHSDDLGLPLRWIGLLREQVAGSIAATSGIHTAEDAAKALLVGADVAMMTSALLHHGPGHVSVVEVGLRWWMEANGYESVEQLKGSAASHTGADPTAFERANYLQTLTSYSTDPAPTSGGWS